MTQENFKLKYSPVAMPCPFAGGSDAALTPIQDVAGVDNDVNFTDGFPSVYSSPSGNNGKFVTRGQMNAIGNLASRNDFYKRCGGLNTFDPVFAGKIGGYPKDAVLDYIVGNKIFKVISLVDNNNFNYIEYGIDNINWRALNQDDADVGEEIFFEGATGVSPGTAMLGIILARKSGGLRVVSSISPNYEGEVLRVSMNPGAYWDFGCSIALKDLGESIPSSIPFPQITLSGNIPTGVNWNGWMQLSGDFSWCYADNATRWNAALGRHSLFSNITQGHYYAIALLAGEGNFRQYSTDIGGYVAEYNEFKSLSGTLKLTYAQ